jgi:hypothetical protein
MRKLARDRSSSEKNLEIFFFAQQLDIEEMLEAGDLKDASW